MAHRFLFPTVLSLMLATQDIAKCFLIGLCVRTKHYLKTQPLFKSLIWLVEPQFSHEVDLLSWGEMPPLVGRNGPLLKINQL